jgi:hypothetical protein
MWTLPGHRSWSLRVHRPQTMHDAGTTTDTDEDVHESSPGIVTETSLSTTAKDNLSKFGQHDQASELTSEEGADGGGGRS